MGCRQALQMIAMGLNACVCWLCVVVFDSFQRVLAGFSSV
jgi:hypothetical protein